MRYFETTHTAATAKAPARQGTKCRVQWMQMGYICWHLYSLDDSGGCKCFSVDRWGDTRHRIQLRCILHIDILIILCFEVYLWNELSAVADGWMIFSKKTKVISMRELIEICGLFIQMGRSGIDQGVHHNWYSWCTHVFYPCFFTRPSWHTGDPCFDGRVRVAIRGSPVVSPNYIDEWCRSHVYRNDTTINFPVSS